MKKEKYRKKQSAASKEKKGSNNPGICLNSQSQREKLYVKFLLKEKKNVLDKNGATFFAQSLCNYEDKGELLKELVRSDTLGLDRLKDAISFGSEHESFKRITVPILDLFSSSEWKRPILRESMAQVLLTIWSSPGFDTVISNVAFCNLSSGDTLKSICFFLLCVVKTINDSRRETSVYNISKHFFSKDIEHSSELLGIMKTVHDRQSVCSEILVENDNPIVQPGWEVNFSNHDNENEDFRQIKIMPTPTELLASSPLLPKKRQFVFSDRTNLMQHSYQLLDRQFRLLREDMISAVKENITKRDVFVSNARYVLKNARVTGIGFEKYLGGLSYVSVSFSVPEKWKKKFWEDHAKALFPVECAVSLVEVTENIPENMRLSFIGVVVSREEGYKGCLGISFEKDSEKAISSLHNREKKFILAMTTKDFFAFRPILEAFQIMHHIPFPEEILYGISVPLEGMVKNEYDIPNYVTLPEDICLENSQYVFNRTKDLNLIDMTAKTRLDHSQATALYRSFKYRVSLIQGPPGTGKTFIGSAIARTLLKNASNIRILCLCYTNHALDQFLENLLDHKIKNIVRIGSRSSNPLMEQFNIKTLCKNLKYNSSNAYQHWRLKNLSAKSMEKINLLNNKIKSSLEWKEIESYSNDVKMMPNIYNDEDMKDDQKVMDFVSNISFADFVKAQDEEKSQTCREKLKEWLSGRKPPTNHFMTHNPIWNLSKSERQEAFEEIKVIIRRQYVKMLHDATNHHNSLANKFKELREQTQLNVIQHAQVIGLTTSKAARCRNLLEEARPEVAIIEEAGEVLEAHVIASLVSGVKQLIMIGDHQQLRPKINSYDLSCESGKGHDLNCSLFERLLTSKNDLEYTTLQTQHRMRPEISNLIRSCTYPSLKDHSSVLDRPPIKGLGDKNVIFIKHDQFEEGMSKKNKKPLSVPMETGNESIISKFNIFESSMVLEIVRYLLLQGYKPKEITVVTPYLAQMRLIQKELNKGSMKVLLGEKDQDEIEDEMLKELDDKTSQDAKKNLKKNEQKLQANDFNSKGGIRVATVDNYQGEECDIIIVSLVRSNDQGQIGFLKEPERVNVLLSRARNGLIILGNENTLREAKSKKGKYLWDKVFSLLEETNSVFHGFPAVCENHNEDGVNLLKNPHMFKEFCPDGGCRKICKGRLNCGHACEAFCHQIDCNSISKCMKPCSRVRCSRGHRCTKRCFEKCGKCYDPIYEVELSCGHIKEKVPCAQMDDLSKVKCLKQVQFSFECGHVTDVALCHEVKLGVAQCSAECGFELPCRHTCKVKCNLCLKKDGHTKCKQKCKKPLICGHLCEDTCHFPDSCPPCKSKCSLKCVHSQCKKKCAEWCNVCLESCEWQCDHEGHCTRPCGAPCSRLPCNRRCSKLLRCGHQCPSLCGEHCPSKEWCQQCGTKNDEVVDLYLHENFGNINLDDDLQQILVLSCGHAFTAETMDNLLVISDGYKLDERGSRFSSTKPLDAYWSLKQCPNCRKLINGILRYGRILKMCELNTLGKKFILNGQNFIREMSKKTTSALMQPDVGIHLKLVDEFKNQIQILKTSHPLQLVTNACKPVGSESDDYSTEFPAPSNKALLDTLLAFSRYMVPLTEKMVTEAAFGDATVALTEVIDIATESKNIRVSSEAMLIFVQLFIQRIRIGKDKENDEILQEKGKSYLDWIFQNAAFSQDLITKASDLYSLLKDAGRLSIEEIKKIMDEVSRIEGGSVGGWGGAGHWFMCPNSHVYYIGECGGMVTTSRCPDCGTAVGGKIEMLLCFADITHSPYYE